MRIKRTATFFIGAPGAGKSTEAYRLALLLKELGESVFFVQERATRLAFSDKLRIYPKDQLFLEQYVEIEEAISSNTQHIVCDTSQVLSLVYDRDISGHEDRVKAVKTQLNRLKEAGFIVELRLIEIVDKEVTKIGRLEEHTDFEKRLAIQNNIKSVLKDIPELEEVTKVFESNK